MHTPLTQQSWRGLTMLLFRHSVGTNQDMSSHTACQGTHGHNHLSTLWTDPGLIRGIRVRHLISTLKTRKKCRRGMNCRTFSRNPCKEKAPTTISSVAALAGIFLLAAKATGLLQTNHMEYQIIYTTVLSGGGGGLTCRANRCHGQCHGVGRSHTSLWTVEGGLCQRNHHICLLADLQNSQCSP